MPTNNAFSKLESKYKLVNRYANFGAVIRNMKIFGFRGLLDLTIEFDFPITAISGINGAGKSTVGQLAVCGYKKNTTAIDYNRFYVAQFFPVSIADPKPFSDDAKVIYTLETNVASSPQEVTVSRTATEWSGYKRQPERYCFYIGFTLYIPKVERRDMSIYGSRTLQLRDKRSVSDIVGKTVANILNQAYEDVHFQEVCSGNRTSELGILKKFSNQYSENNMGFGEGRILHLVSLMEEAPQQSLFVLEEPETSLHEEAQYRLIQYLIDVCERRGHQVIFSTHSSVMLEALPSQARKLLHRSAEGVEVYNGISSTRARAILSGGEQRALSVLVEDDFASNLLHEIVRAEDPSLLKAISINWIGSKDDVREGVRLLKKLNRKVIGIRDGDVGTCEAENLFAFPGSTPPEIEVFNNPTVIEYLNQKFAIDIHATLATEIEIDHHDIPEILANTAEANQQYFELCAIAEYVKQLSTTDRKHLVEVIAKNA